jgi:hypothetical protein
MKGKGFDKMVTDWVGTNLVEVPGTQPGVGPYEWAFHVENCDAMYTSYANSWWVEAGHIRLAARTRHMMHVHMALASIDAVVARGLMRAQHVFDFGVAAARGAH